MIRCTRRGYKYSYQLQKLGSTTVLLQRQSTKRKAKASKGGEA